MMRKIKVGLFCVVVTGCSPAATDEFASTPVGTGGNAAGAPSTNNDLLDRLIGDWQDTGTDGTTVLKEHWTRTSDRLLSGIGLVLSGRDTVFVEYLGIRTEGYRTFYSARIPSQNNGATVDFALTAVHGDSLVFEDPTHDFPQRITYAWSEADDAWNVRLTGIGVKGSREERSHFQRSGGSLN